MEIKEGRRCNVILNLINELEEPSNIFLSCSILFVDTNLNFQRIFYSRLRVTGMEGNSVDCEAVIAHSQKERDSFKCLWLRLIISLG
jgi:hypothetical protein